jgi:hypothetical protein
MPRTVKPTRPSSPERADAIIRHLLRAGRSAAGEDPAALAEILAHALPAHFAVEEAPGGFFDRLRASGGAVTADRLAAEHVSFRHLLALGTAEALDELAQRLRGHERIEAAAAARLGELLPGDGDDPAVPALDPDIAAALEQLVAAVVRETAAHGDSHLAGIRVALPGSIAWSACVPFLERDLVASGLDFVEIAVESGEGPPSLLACCFEPG